MSQRIRPFRPFSSKVSVVLLTATAAAAAAGAARATDTASPPALSVAPPEAHWVQRKFDYTYMGFTDHFSCDGLRDTVKAVLLALGARKEDLQVQERGCSRLEGPEPFPGVTARFSVLVPVTPEDVGKVGDAKTHPTVWNSVDMVRLTQESIRDAPCELLEQLKTKLLPMFTTRNLSFESHCVPHEYTPGEITFKVDTLKVAPSAGSAMHPAPAS